MIFVAPFQSACSDSVTGLTLYFHTDLVLTISLVVPTAALALGDEFRWRQTLVNDYGQLKVHLQTFP